MVILCLMVLCFVFQKALRVQREPDLIRARSRCNSR
jgi:hypothetical protein